MENFAIDIDKVLDDFELNEDEHENSMQYDKLQLQFREKVSNSIDGLQASSSIGVACNLNEATQATATYEREPPDKSFLDFQNSVSNSSDCTNAESEISSSSVGVVSEILANPSLHGGSKRNSENSVQLNVSTDTSFNSTSQVHCDNEKLWPNLPNQNSLFKNLSSSDPFHPISDSVYEAVNRPDSLNKVNHVPNDLGAQSAIPLPVDNVQLPRPLDVIPDDVPSNAGPSVSQEGHHPDILDMMSNCQEERTYDFRNNEDLLNDRSERFERENHSLPENQQPCLSPDIQRDAFLLPDLMPESSIDASRISLDLPHIGMVEASNPAVVTENALSLSINEPAIIQESQSYNMIPEVVNIHQSAEQNAAFLNFQIDNSDENNLRSFDDVFTNSCNRNYAIIGEVHISEAAAISLPDVSDVHNPGSLDLKYMKDDQRSCSPVKFDPHSNVNEEELHSELQELEEEQARLQGAYSKNDCQPVELQFLNVSHSSQSLDLIGGINVSHEISHSINDESEREYADINMKEEEVDIDHVDERLDNMEVEVVSSSQLSEETSYLLGEHSYCLNDNYDFNSKEASDQTPENSPCDKVVEEKLPSYAHENDVSACSNPEALNEMDMHDKVEVNEETLSESTATDTLSSTSTLTDGETPATDHQSQFDSDRPATPPFEPDSPSRETPGTLVTAVYDDIGAAGQSENAEKELSIGAVAPFWIPDAEAPNCLECDLKFTLIRRRHHCRGCGRVLCAPCCHFKAPLPYMDYKEDRVCASCLHILTQEKEEERVENRQASRAPNPNNPMEYCSRIPPQQQVGNVGNGPPPTVMVPVGVLKREASNSGNGSSSRSRGSKQVIFSDGIRPGGDLTESGRQMMPSLGFRKMGRNTRRVAQNIPRNGSGGGGCSDDRNMHSVGGLTPFRTVAPDECLIPSGGGLPPVLLKSSTNGEYLFDSNSDSSKLEEKMISGSEPVVFALQKNLTVLVKQIKLDCCVGLEVWNVATRGLCNVGQEELVVLLEVNPEEKCPPPHLFSFLHTVYQQANKGNVVTELGHSIFTEPEGFLGSKDHGGFIYIRPTYQCLHKLLLPPAPYIFAVLIQKWETPWAKVFPLRLMLRLGAEFRYYPCPLVSTRTRKPVYCEIGHTIMNLLVDFRNYTYTIPVIQGFVIHMEDKKTTLLIPRNRYEQIWKALNNSNDHVLALGANFSLHADSHLVTVEDDDGQYSTQAINIHNKPRKVTGASFIVFNGALKSTSGLKAKSSIVEDGLMVQISGEMMTALRDSLRNMKEYDIPCGPASSSEHDELILVRWVQDDTNFNIGIKSPIDDKQMDGIPSVKIHSSTDYVGIDHLIRWTEVFIIQGEASSSNNDVNISRLAESLARACCMALIPHLALLYDSGPNRLALRTTIHQDNVEYEAGVGGKRLLPICMNELDAELIPVIHRAAANITDQAIILELLFHIMEQ